MRSLCTSYIDTTTTYSAEGSHERSMPLTSGVCGSAEGRAMLRFAGAGDIMPCASPLSDLVTFLTREAVVRFMKWRGSFDGCFRGVHWGTGEEARECF